MAIHCFDDGEAYDQFMGRWSRKVGRALLYWLQPPTGAYWLDFGCGTGIFTELISDFWAPASVIAVDPTVSQIAHAHKGARGKAQFRLADAQELPFRDASFDVVASALVMNFVPDRERAISEMRRVARPGGLVAASVWDFAADLSPSGPLRRAMQRVGIVAPAVPGTDASKLGVLANLFENGRLRAVTGTTIEVTVSFRNFDDFLAFADTALCANHEDDCCNVP